MAVLTKNKPKPTVNIVAQVPEVEWETITPDVAQDYLATNHELNRNYIKALADRYAADMTAGQWRAVGDPIQFDRLGHLINGQHRLRALIRTGIAQKFLVVRGIDPEDFSVIDTGRARRPQDMLKIMGYPQTALLGGTARTLLHIKAGPLTFRGRNQVTHSEILALVERHPHLIECCSRSRPLRGIRPSLLVAFNYIGRFLTPYAGEADAFIEVFNTGIPSYDGDPAHLWREKILRERTASGRMYHSKGFTLLAMAHVWNLFVERRKVQALRFPDRVEIKDLELSKI